MKLFHHGADHVHMHKEVWMSSVLIIILASILSAGCVSSDTLRDTQKINPPVQSINLSGYPLSWISVPMTEVNTGKTITIADLLITGKPIIIHTFAVWCPSCTIQLQESTRLVSDNPDTYIVLAMDIDPKEKAVIVKNHVQKNKFSEYFVNAPLEVSRDIVKTLGTGTALSLPQTIIITNGTVTLLGDGVFREANLKETITHLSGSP
jgi:thiol-disulfide isomerase/thioredoxin